MKKISFIILIALASVFVSCSKEDVVTEVKSIEDTFKFSKSVTIYTSDSLSNAIILLSSDNSEFIEETAMCLKLRALNFDYSSCKVSEKGNGFAVDSDSEKSALERSIEIKIVRFNSEYSTMILSMEKTSRLKSVTPWENHYYYGEVESNVPYAAIRYLYKSYDPYGIYVEPRHKETWLSSWGYPAGEKQHLHESSEDQYLVQSPWNDNDPTYMHGFKVTTNESDNAMIGNFEYIAQTTPIY